MLCLAHPDPTAWRRLAMTTAVAAGRAGTTLPVISAAAAINQASRHLPVAPAGHDTGIAALTWATLNGQPAATVLERNGSPLPTAVLSHDTGAPPDKARWTDWLHVGNLLQHLGDHAVIVTTRTFTPETGPRPSAPPTATSSGTRKLLADVFDPAALPLAEAAISAGWDQLVVGFASGDADDTPIEVAWPTQRVGILPTDGSRPSTLTDWDLRTPDQWTVAKLLTALNGGSS